VVKFGDFRLIDAEYRNYHEYVEKFIGEGRSTAVPPDGLRRTARLGGIIYSLLGGAVEQTESFGSFYANADIEQIKRVLDGLFFETCKGWYSNPGAQRLLNLTEEYKRELNFTTEGLTRALSEGLKSVQGKQKLRFGSLLAERTFTNPLLAMTGFNFEESTYVCTTHGDLNENNILVDESSHTWLIDFDSTGRGHILRDVAELDSVLRFRLLGPEEATLEERLKMEESLCRPRRFRDIEQLEATFSTDNPAVAKTFAATLHLRTIARRLVLQSDEINEYYVALFYYAVNAIRFYSLSTVQRLHALLSASLIVDLLE
jgi:hypothetical protein